MSMTLGIVKWIFVDVLLIVSAIYAAITKHKKSMSFSGNSKIEKYFGSLAWLMGAMALAVFF